MANKKYTAKQMIEALEATKGMKTLAAKRLGCSYPTVQRYIDEYPTVRQAYEEQKGSIDDTVRLRMIEKINAGDTAMIIFYAKTRLPEFREVQRHEHTGKDGGAIVTRNTFENLSDDDLDHLLENSD